MNWIFTCFILRFRLVWDTQLKNFLPSLEKNIRHRDTRLVSGKCLGNMQLCLCVCPERPPPRCDWKVYHLPHAIPNWILTVSRLTLLQNTQHTATAGSSSKDMEWYFFLEHDVQGTDSGEGNVSSGPPSKGSNISSYYKQNKYLEQDWNAGLPIARSIPFPLSYMRAPSCLFSFKLKESWIHCHAVIIYLVKILFLFQNSL